MEMTSQEISESDLRRCNMSSGPLAKRPASKNMEMRAQAMNLLHSSQHAHKTITDQHKQNFPTRPLYSMSCQTARRIKPFPKPDPLSPALETDVSHERILLRLSDDLTTANGSMDSESQRSQICGSQAPEAQKGDSGSTAPPTPQSGAWPQTKRGMGNIRDEKSGRYSRSRKKKRTRSNSCTKRAK